MTLIFDWYYIVLNFIEVFTLHSSHFHITPYYSMALLTKACFWPDIFLLLEQYMLTNRCQHHHQPTDADQ